MYFESKNKQEWIKKQWWIHYIQGIKKKKKKKKKEKEKETSPNIR